MERLLTVKQVSELLGKGDRRSKFVYELARNKKIPCAKIGGQVLFKESDVERYVRLQFNLQN